MHAGICWNPELCDPDGSHIFGRGTPSARPPWGPSGICGQVGRPHISDGRLSGAPGSRPGGRPSAESSRGGDAAASARSLGPRGFVTREKRAASPIPGRRWDRGTILPPDLTPELEKAWPLDRGASGQANSS